MPETWIPKAERGNDELEGQERQRETRQFTKLITRDAPMVVVESWYRGMTKETGRFFEFPFPENIFIFTGGTVERYVDQDFVTIIPRKVASWAKENRNKLVHGYEAQRRTLNLIAKIQKSSTNSPQVILAQLADLRESFALGVPGLVITYLIPFWQETFAKRGESLFDTEAVETSTQWRREVDPFFDKSVEAIYMMLSRLADALYWDASLLKFSLFAELTANVAKGVLVDRDALEKRRGSHLAYIGGRLMLGETEESLFHQLVDGGVYLIREKADVVTEISGAIAHKGMVRGAARIVRHRGELSKVLQGDVLIAPMTTPWYMPALKRAAAIVTDEGGITSHAAIVARELGIPCVIGTKIATTALHDGDEVEVDATNGVVRVLRHR